MVEPARKRAEKIIAKRVPSRSVSAQKKNAAQTLASIIELHMTGLGLSEGEKNRRVAKFGARVDKAIGSPAKS